MILFFKGAFCCQAAPDPVLLAPKEKGIIIWKFENAVDIEIACNVPGHYQAGMIAVVNLN